MPADRFYLDAPLLKGNHISIEGTEHHHLSHVMKLEVGEEIELINGKGVLSLGKITKMDKKRSFVEIISSEYTPQASPYFILAIPMMRPSKLEWVIEKGTELGADLFLIYKADHSEKESLSEHQMERLQSLSVAASKQSGRLYLPSFEVLAHLEHLWQHKAAFFFGDTRVSTFQPIGLQEQIGFITGPERGFSVEELKSLEENAVGVSLSANILRAETAPIAAMSILGQLRKK